jgi:hypothetical protein
MRNKPPQPIKTSQPAGMGETVKQQGVQAWVAGQYL